MKTWLAIMACSVFAGVMVSERLAASERGYSRHDGTHVQPHYRTNPNGHPFHHYESLGCYNPHTGKFAPRGPEDFLDRYDGMPRGFKTVDPSQNPSSRRPNVRITVLAGSSFAPAGFFSCQAVSFRRPYLRGLGLQTRDDAMGDARPPYALDPPGDSFFRDPVAGGAFRASPEQEHSSFISLCQLVSAVRDDQHG